MIKLCSFQFEELPSKNHWVDFAKFGSLLKFDLKWYDSYRDVDQSLSQESSWQIGMDQSTSCCGIVLKNYENTMLYMVEVSRSKGQDANDAIFDLEMFLHQFCKDATITHLIYERPIKAESFRSSQILFQLEGMIRALAKRYDEFKPARLDFIENSSWRSVVILEKYKDGTERKLASRLSIQEIFDWTTIYDESLGRDEDIYEAMGVLFGWFINSFDTLGRPYVRGDRYNGVIGGFILPFMSAEKVASQFKEAGIESVWAVQNPRKSIYENLVCYIEKYKVACVELTEAYAMLALSVECNMKWMNPDKMTVILVAPNYVDSRLYAITGKDFHFIL